MQFARWEKPLLGNFQFLGQSFPLLNQASVVRLLLLEFRRLPLSLFRADEALQCGFQPPDLILGAAYFPFQFGDPIFYLLALDGIQAPLRLN